MVGPAQARRQQVGHGDGCTAQGQRSRRGAGARRRHHRAAAVPTRRVPAGREGQAGRLDSAGPDRDGRLPDRAADGHLAVARNRSAPPASSPGSCANPKRLGELAKLGFRAEGGDDAEERRHRLRARSRRPCPSATPRCGPRWPTRSPHQRAPPQEPGGHDHARPVDDRRRGRQDPVGQRHRRTGHADCRRCRRPRRSGCGRSTASRADPRCRRDRSPIRSTGSPARRRSPRHSTVRPHQAAVRCRSPRCG